MAIQVVVHGAFGKMGREVVNAVCKASDMRLVGAASRSAEDGELPLPNGGKCALSSVLKDVLSGADVIVDFTNAEGAMMAIRAAAPQKIAVVTGSTGLSQASLDEAQELAAKYEVGVIIAPNFALGAVLMVHLAKIAGRFFDYADLIEMHHEAKIDAPSGTALAIARAAAAGKGGPFASTRTKKETLPGTRGGELSGVSVHSARMPGRVAHHELVFGALGQTLTLRHDSINRESFMPGVLMAIREVGKRPGLTVGLENIMGL